jgi:alcohol dehydrogenase class IV
MSFNYYMPTQVIMGRNAIQNNAALFKALGKKALIVTGRNSARICGALSDIEEALKSQGMAWCLFDEVENNPSTDTVRKAAIFGKQNEADFVIGCGGGSPLDAAKVISLLMVKDMDDETLFSQNHDFSILPIIAIPTTAGTGSEVTPYSILTDKSTLTKRNVSSKQTFPRIAFLDGKYTQALPQNITINTVIDALSHSVEGLLAVRANKMSDFIAKEAITLIAKNINKLKNELSLEARDELLYASMLSGMVIAQTGTTVLHAMGYSLTYFKNIDHGRANGLLMPEYFDFLLENIPQKMRLILDLMGYDSINKMKEEFEELFGERENIGSDELEFYAQIAIKAKSVSNTPVTVTDDDVLAIYKRSF